MYNRYNVYNGSVQYAKYELCKYKNICNSAQSDKSRLESKKVPYLLGT